jgi:alkylated DNA repair dioxygenase AlkB
MSKKHTLDGFFKPAQTSPPRAESTKSKSNHPTYPYPISDLPPHLIDALGFVPASDGKAINDQPDLDLLYFQPYIPKEAERDLFQFLRRELFFYRVQYKIKRGPVETNVNTPRYTTVFGIDESSKFVSDKSIVDAKTKQPVSADRYKCKPRPLPACLDFLRTLTENSTGFTYNFCLVNYYATGEDSISYHSDDERFLGPDPAIASFSLGAKRDFLMKHKPIVPSDAEPSRPEPKPLKLPLASGDMILMRGRTQSKWLHSIPKRKGGESDRGRINITFRKALVKGGTENYYQYNCGSGMPYKWDEQEKKMVVWESAG